MITWYANKLKIASTSKLPNSRWSCKSFAAHRTFVQAAQGSLQMAYQGNTRLRTALIELEALSATSPMRHQGAGRSVLRLSARDLLGFTQRTV